jgi:hypothetical protein
MSSPKATATHFGLAALSSLLERNQDTLPSEDELTIEAQKYLGSVEFEDESVLPNAIGEMYVLHPRETWLQLKSPPVLVPPPQTFQTLLPSSEAW